ncbi:hypothetical protein ACXWR7_11480, partial [Streptococcus pyogenes]
MPGSPISLAPFPSSSPFFPLFSSFLFFSLSFLPFFPLSLSSSFSLSSPFFPPPSLSPSSLLPSFSPSLSLFLPFFPPPFFLLFS